MNLEGYPREAVLKDGRRVTLRPMVGEDALKLKLLFIGLPEKERTFVRDCDIHPEMDVPWPEDHDYGRVLPILALDGDQIVGIATLHRNSYSWNFHLGNIRITVCPDYRRKGLGRILLGEIFRNTLGIGLDKVMVEIVKDQIDISLFFNRLGFRTEASLSDHYLDEQGDKHDVIIMSNNLKQLWKLWVEHESASNLKNKTAVRTERRRPRDRTNLLEDRKPQDTPKEVKGR